MRTLFAALVFGFALCAQTSSGPWLTVTVTPATVVSGSPAEPQLTVSLVDPTGTIAAVAGSISGVSLASPPSWLQGPTLSATQTVATLKSANFLVAGTGTPTWAPNNNPLASGSAPVVLFSAPISAPTSNGTSTITLVNLTAASTTGQSVPISLATTATLTVTCNPYAVTGDCTVSQSDINAMVEAELSSACPAPLNAAGDGLCDVTVVENTILSAIGKLI
jgi:hypothetical protein